jgi:predicted ABC-type ATPase
MADIAPKLIHMSGEQLLTLHKRIHKSEATPATVEVHHTILNEMARRKMERPSDNWDAYEILVDSIDNVQLDSLTQTFSQEVIQEVIKSTGSDVGNLQTFLTVDGYKMKIVPVELSPFEKMIREENGKFVVYNEEGTRKFGTYKTEEEAKERLEQMERFSKAVYTPPKAVRVAARRAIGWIEDGRAGSGFTSVGRRRASQLAKGEAVSLETLKRMKSFFARHQVDKEALGFSQGEKGFPSGGRVAWDAWGGDAGYSWAESMISRAEDVEKHLQGQHDQQRHAPGYADKIADAINNGENPSVMPLDVGPLMSEFAKRTDHPDLTELKVDGTMLYGGEGLGIARIDMPQVPGERRNEFLADLAKEGVKTTEENIDPKTLKPVQKEISASRSGAIYEHFKKEGAIPDQQRILVSKDGYVIDGHHTWGASVAFAFDNPSARLPIYRIDLNAREALDAANGWADSKGIGRQAIDAANKARRLFVWKHLEVTKHQEHDQSTHGSWANANNSGFEDTQTRRADILRTGEIPPLPRNEQGQVINPDATGGYKAGIPEEINYKGGTYTPNDSLWHHLVPDGKGGFEPSQERMLLHSLIIAESVNGIPESSNPTFHMLGGGPASGKTTFLKSGQTEVPDRDRAVHISADDVKEGFPEMNRMRYSKIDGDFFGAAAFTHEESSMLAKRIQSRAILENKDVVLDGTGDSSIKKLSGKVEEARQKGYKVNGTYINIPTETAWERATARALGESKRFVPESVVRGTHSDVSRTFPQAISAGLFEKVSLYDNSGSTPRLVGSGTRSSFNVVDQSAYNEFLEKGRG